MDRAEGDPVATGGKDREARESRERARVYSARKQLHDDQARRRRRDNLVAGIVGGILILGVVGAQAAYFMVGPGAPPPAPSPSATPTPVVSSTEEPTPSPTVTP
jgi:hypothetical protein